MIDSFRCLGALMMACLFTLIILMVKPIFWRGNDKK